LAELASAAGAAGAAGLWDRAAAADPRNLGLQLARFDLAVRAGDEKALDRVVADIGKADGEDGKPGQTARLVTALRAVWRAQKKGDPSGLADAQEKLEGLEKERPDWARVEFALAVVYDLQRKSDEALAKYRDAVEDGETTPDAARRLAELLFARGRMTEAEAAVRRLPEGYTGGGMLLEKMRTQFLLGKDPKAALAAAEKVVRPTSTGYEDQMWLGQVAWAAKDPAKAEAALRRAAALKPDQTGPWLTLVRVLAATGRRDEAARVAAEAEGKVAPAERGLFGALAAAALGKTEEAVGRFGKARGERPDDLRTLQAEAEYLFSIGRLKEAREAFRRVLGLPKASAEEKVFATRMLAAGLAADPDPATAREALRVLGLWDEKTGRVKDLAPTAPAADRRAAAGALALQKDRDSKLKAITLLEAVGLTALDPAELFLLAQVYQEVAGPTHKLNVRTAMAELLRRSDAVPLYVGYYAGWLLKEKDPAAAARWVGRYAELQPGTPLATELQARLAAAEGKKDEAARALRAGADRPDAPLGLLARIAEDIGLPDEAEG
ncbi:MAG: tetratricopeptide repeat protein, partial [Gemmataceae bacterium]|nr:tetratricopeptide repeat protein [Gemmataceae bacterium]